MSAAVLVPSYDGYSDIWPIAADLFSRFWPDRQFPMYWMTNGKPVPKIAQPILVPKIEREQWGRNIATAIERIPEPFILFWVEEIFLLSKVPNEVLMQAVEILANHPEIGIIGLTRYYDRAEMATIGSFAYSRPNSLEFTSALPALFRREVLLHLLRALPKSNDFEQQSHVVMRRDLPNVQSLTPARPMFRFCDNALLQGPWRKCAAKHMRDLGIKVDFSRRGIHPEPCRLMDGNPE